MRSLLCLGLLCALEAGAEPLVVYTRATPVEARAGVVAIRMAQEALVDVPVDCPDAGQGTFGCRGEERFTRVYGLDFTLERRDARNGSTRFDVEDRGRVFLFLRLERDDLRDFDDEMRRTLLGLAADAFVEDFAGLEPAAAFLARVARLSPQPSFSCFESGPSRTAARYDRQTEKGSDGRVSVVSSGTSTYSLAALADPLCEAGHALLQSIPPDDLRTMPSARALREETVRVDAVDSLPAVAHPEDLVPLPDGFSYTVAEAPGVVRSLSRHSRDANVTASFTRDGVQYSAEVTPASFPPYVVATRGWLARWTIEARERELGPEPRDTLAGRSDLRVALAPTVPPTPVDEERRPTGEPESEAQQPSLDAEAYVAEIAARLDRTGAFEPGTLAELLASDPAGLESPGWILFICREASATFELLPTRAASDVINAGELCAAIDRALARAGVESP